MTNRKAVSEVIAALLLIMITVAGAVMLYAYASGLMGHLQGTSNQQPYLQQIALEYYDWTVIGTLKLTVRNVGSASAAIQSADWFVNGQKIATPGGTCTGSLNPQTSCRADLTVSFASSLTVGFSYPVKLATKEGAIFSYSCILGQTGVP